MHGKKFHFYVNKCASCSEITDISFRPHKARLCRKCTAKVISEKNGRVPLDIDYTPGGDTLLFTDPLGQEVVEVVEDPEQYPV